MDNLPQARLYVDGKLRAAAGNRTYDNICPWTGEATTNTCTTHRTSRIQ